MLCEQCQQNTADVLVTRFQSESVSRTQLCHVCAAPVLDAIGPDEVTGATYLSPDAAGNSAPLPNELGLRGPITVEEFAAALHLRPFQVVGTLMRLGVFVSRRSTIDFATTERVCSRYGVKLSPAND